MKTSCRDSKAKPSNIITFVQSKDLSEIHFKLLLFHLFGRFRFGCLGIGFGVLGLSHLQPTPKINASSTTCCCSLCCKSRLNGSTNSFVFWNTCSTFDWVSMWFFFLTNILDFVKHLVNPLPRVLRVLHVQAEIRGLTEWCHMAILQMRSYLYLIWIISGFLWETRWKRSLAEFGSCGWGRPFWPQKSRIGIEQSW